MILGSHSSLSYLKPDQRIFKLFSFTNKTQSEDYIEQYELGVRAFDIGIWFDLSTEEPVVKYGYCIYDKSEKITNILKYLNLMGDCYVRLTLEDSSILGFSFSKCYIGEQERLFSRFCEKVKLNYPRIHFFGGHSKSSNLVVASVLDNGPTCYEKYSSSALLLNSKSDTDNLFHNIFDKLFNIFPRLFAKVWNKKNKNKYNMREDSILFIDFVNL